MKNVLLKCSWLCTSMLFVFSSCDKEDIKLNNGSPLFTVKTLFAGLSAEPQLFAIEAGSPQVIEGISGTRLVFHAETFKTASGETVRSGIIKIELTEIYTPADMIGSRAYTFTEKGNYLSNNGIIGLKATVNGIPVYASGGYRLYFKQKMASRQARALFQGIQGLDDISLFLYAGTDSTHTVTGTWQDTIADDQHFYVFDTCLIETWTYCSNFIAGSGAQSNIRVAVPDSSFNNSNTQVFVILKESGTVIGLTGYNPGTHTFNLEALPLGTSMDLVVLGARNNSYFIDFRRNLKVKQNMLLEATPFPLSLESIKDSLQSL